jgi:membrane protein YqaA with SNARE-associated domain
MTQENRLALLRWLTLLLVVVIVALIFIYRERVQDLLALGYLGIFLVALISNATVLVPVPGVMVVFAAGAIFHPFFTALAAGLGAGLGEVSGYMLGFSGQGIAERSFRYERIIDWMQRHYKLRDLSITFLAAIPNPLFDVAGVAAGTIKVPLWRFLLFVTLGTTIKMLIFAYAGDTVVNTWFRLE